MWRWSIGPAWPDAALPRCRLSSPSVTPARPRCLAKSSGRLSGCRSGCVWGAFPAEQDECAETPGRGQSSIPKGGLECLFLQTVSALPRRVALGYRGTLLLPLVTILCVGAGCLPQMAAAPSGDLWLYYAASSYVTGDILPYRDFPFEYPPLALFPLSLPRIALLCRGLTFSTYLWAFLVEGATLGALLAVTIWTIVRPGITSTARRTGRGHVCRSHSQPFAAAPLAV